MPEKLTPAQRAQVLRVARTMVEEGSSALSVKNFLESEYGGTFTYEEITGGASAEGGEGPGVIEGLARSAVQGATFGFSDEIAGLLSKLAPGGMDYGERVASERKQQEQFREEHPFLSIGGEIAGGMALPLGGAALGAGRGLARLLPSLGGQGLRNIAKRGALLGAGEGALYGAGTGEGGVGDRAAGAAMGGAVGGVAGGVLAPALSAVGRAGTRVLRGLGSETQGEAGKVVQHAIGEGLRASGASAEDLARKGAALKGSTLLDFNNATRQMARAVHNAPGGADALVDAAVARTRGGPQRMAGRMLRELDDDAALKSVDDILQDGRAQINAVRELLFGALDKGENAITNPALKALVSGNDALTDYVRQVARVSGRKVDDFRPREWGAVDEALGAEIKKAEPFAKDALLALKLRLRGEMGEWGTRLDLADVAYRQASVVDEAFEAGRALATGRGGLGRVSQVDFDAARRTLSDALEGEQLALARKRLNLGMVKQMEDELGKMSDVANVEKLFTEMSATGRTVLDDVFGPQGLERVRQAALIEREFARSANALLGNSSTAMQAQYSSQLSGSIHWKAAIGRAIELATEISPEMRYKVTQEFIRVLGLSLSDITNDPKLMRMFFSVGLGRQAAGHATRTGVPILGGMGAGAAGSLLTGQQ